jgi:arylformamidase
MEKVWLDLDQCGLDRAYDQRQFSPNMQEVLASYAARSDATRERLVSTPGLAYGVGKNERVDFYPSQSANAATQIFIHGGAWRGGAAKNYGFLADFFHSAGVNLLVADFDSVEQAKYGLATMMDQVRRMITWAYTQATALGIDPSNIHLFGHSSGAHLVASALTTDWERDFQVPSDLIRSASCCSGIYDLKPVRLSSRNGYLNLSDDIEESLSPQRHVHLIKAPLMIAHGQLESPEFIRQARDFALSLDASANSLKRCELIQINGQNHFEVLANMTQPDSVLAGAMLRRMGLDKRL